MLDATKPVKYRGTETPSAPITLVGVPASPFSLSRLRDKTLGNSGGDDDDAGTFLCRQIAVFIAEKGQGGNEKRDPGSKVARSCTEKKKEEGKKWGLVAR